MDKWTPTDWLSSDQAELYQGTEHITAPAAAALLAQALAHQTTSASIPSSASSEGQGLRVLDAGTGLGQLAEQLVQTEGYGQARVVCTDIDDSLLAATRIKAALPSWGGRVEVIKSDVQDMSPAFGDAEFTHVFGNFLYFLLPDPAAGLRESVRVLKPGGVLGLTTWALSGPFGLLQKSLPAGAPRPPAPPPPPHSPSSSTAPPSGQASPPPGPPWSQPDHIRAQLAPLPLHNVRLERFSYAHTAPSARELARDMRPVVFLLVSKWPKEAQEKYGWAFFENIERTLEAEYRQADGSVAVKSEAWIVTAVKTA